MLELENPGQAYLLRQGDEVILIDTGIAGEADNIAKALLDWGLEPSALTHVLLTHWHPDHVGSAAELRSWPSVKIWAGRPDADIIAGHAQGSFPNLTPSEAAFYEQVVGGVPEAQPITVDRQLDGDEVLDEIGAQIVAAPGHTDGSIAIYFPEKKILFTGDVATAQEGQVILGPFDTDRDQAKASFKKLAAFDVEVVCFGHGAPLVGSDTKAFTDAVNASVVPDPLG